MRADDDIVEIGPIRAQGDFVIGALVKIVPREGVELRFGHFGEIEDVYLFQQIGQLTVFLVCLQQRGGGHELKESTDGLAEPQDLSETAWVVEWNGKVLREVPTPSRNTSGMAVGGGYVWMCANAPPQGVFQVDMNSQVVSHRQIPLGPANDGGGCHGAF